MSDLFFVTLRANKYIDQLPDPQGTISREKLPKPLSEQLSNIQDIPVNPSDRLLFFNSDNATVYGFGVVNDVGDLSFARLTPSFKLSSAPSSGARKNIVPEGMSLVQKFEELRKVGQLAPPAPSTVAPSLPVAPIPKPPSRPAEPTQTPTRPQNVILYGPPGTGKTYSVMSRTLKLLGEPIPDPNDFDALRARFDQLRTEGRVDMLTFHQAYEYEEFIEGIRPVLDDNEVGYELRSGVFKRLCGVAAALAKRSMPAVREEELSFERVWTALVEEIERGVQLGGGKMGLRRGSSIETKLEGVVEVNHRSAQISWLPPGRAQRKNAPRQLLEVLWHVDPTGQLADADYSYHSIYHALEETGNRSAHNIEILWRVYRRMRELERAGGQKGASLEPHLPKLNDYEGLEDVFDRSTLTNSQKLAAVPFTTAPACVLIIDEINRGNIAKIFGELITLIEPSKRLGLPEGALVTLPYSQELFGVPANLHILGTMNTADRSIALMDIALRRRFTFEELMPDAARLQEVLEEAWDEGAAKIVADALRCINARIEFLLDRDHTIGHAYFMGARSWQDVRAVMVDRVIPLLREYFYGADDRVCAALGCPYKDGVLQGPMAAQKTKGTASTTNGQADPDATSTKNSGALPWITAKKLNEQTVLGYDHDDYESDRIIYEVNSKLSTNADDAVIKSAMEAIRSAALLKVIAAKDSE